MAKAMGMMSGCYFVGRTELLEWINDLLGIDYDKVEDVSNGAAFCQVIDAVHPGSVPLGRVNYNAITEAEMVENYKILQDAFDKNGITQHIDVPTLCKGKYMAALEMFQWIHGYYEQMGGTSGKYDGPGRRKQTRCKDPTPRGRPHNKPAGMAKRQLGGAVAPRRDQSNVRVGGVPGTAEGKKGHVPPKRPVREEEPSVPAQQVPAGPKVGADPNQGKEVKALKRQVAELKEELEQMTEERDFYYNKLRKIEIFCDENEDEQILQSVMAILIETDEDNHFLPPEDDD